jgi:hypothetical protein
MPLILMIVGFVLIIYNYRVLKKEKTSSENDDSLNISFQGILQDSKEQVNDYKIEVGALRRDIAESLTELQEEIIEIKNDINKLKKYEEPYENKSSMEIMQGIESDDTEVKINKIRQDNLINYNTSSEEVVISEINFSNKVENRKNIDSSKTESIKRLLEEGLTEEQICHKLSVSKGEVLLVKGLFKK